MQRVEENQVEVGAALHKRRAQRRKAGFEKKLAAAKIEKGLLIVNTGPGKGKTTAAIGMGIRTLGHGLKLGVVQFIKGALASGEREFLAHLRNCDFYTLGDGYTWNTQDRDADIASARKAWAEAVRMIESPDYHMVILDELNVVLRYHYLDLAEILNVLSSRRKDLHVVVTGRHAPPEIITIADLVSDIRSLKHPYREQGVKAQKGVEY